MIVVCVCVCVCVCVQVVYFASETFHYHKADRMRIKMRRFATEQWPDTIGRKVSSGLPLKVSQLGSHDQLWYSVTGQHGTVCTLNCHMTMS